MIKYQLGQAVRTTAYDNKEKGFDLIGGYVVQFGIDAEAVI